jgi:hypothetical protein
MEIEVFLALKSAGVPDSDARHAATAIRSGVAEEVREAQKGGATTADIRTLECSIIESKADIRKLESSISELRADFFQRLSDIHKSTLVVMCSSVSLLGVLVTVLKFVG